MIWYYTSCIISLINRAFIFQRFIVEKILNLIVILNEIFEGIRFSDKDEITIGFKYIIYIRIVLLEVFLKIKKILF
jgi:hypothetical protein